MVPDLTIATPQMELQSSALTGGSILIPPLTFDTTGDFDTGALAVSPLTLGAIGIIPRPDGIVRTSFLLARFPHLCLSVELGDRLC